MFMRYAVREITKYYFGKRADPVWPPLYLGLLTTTPASPDAAAVELTAAGYARKYTPDGPDWGFWADQYADAEPNYLYRMRYMRWLDFGRASAPHTVTGWGLWDAATGGNLLFAAAFRDGPCSVAAGQGVVFPPETLVIDQTMAANGVYAALAYLFTNKLSASWYRPDYWFFYPVTRPPTVQDYFTQPFLKNCLPGLGCLATTTNNTTEWPLVGADVTNGNPLVFSPALEAGWPDVIGMVIEARWAAGWYGPYWYVPLTSALTVRRGERIEIPAQSVVFDRV